MSSERSVLVFDVVDGGLASTADRLRRLGFRTIRAKTPEEGVAVLGDRRHRIGAALIPPDLPVVDLAAALQAFREENRERLEFVAVGPQPPLDAVAHLRAADVRLALWEPFPDATLRFQVNRALSGPGFEARRRAPRAPLARQARILARSGVKSALVYSLSAGGAFLETPRPSGRGVGVQLELSLPDHEVETAARVLYTNVPGNLQRENLPVGMAVAFEELEPGTEWAIAHCVATAAAGLEVSSVRAARGRQDRSWIRRFVRRP